MLALAGLAATIAAAALVFVTAQQRTASSRSVANPPPPAATHDAPPSAPTTKEALAPQDPAAQTASTAQTAQTAEDAKSSPTVPTAVLDSDGSETPAPSCDELLAGETVKPRDALRAYDHVREGHRALVLGRWDAAQTAFCRAVLEPDATSSTRLELAQALLIRRDSKAAAEQAQALLAAEPSATRARELLGDALMRMGRRREACELWLTASKLSLPRMGQRDFFEAEQATAQHDFARAERFYRRVIGCQPAHPLAHAKLATTLAKLGQASSAQRWAERALELAPEDRAVRTAVPRFSR